MTQTLKIHQAFVDTFINAAFGLPTAHENAPYDPVIGTAYAEIRVLDAGTQPFSMDSVTVRSDGLFRVLLNYPAEAGAIAAKTMADAIFAVFAIGSTVQYGGLECVITQQQIQPGYVDGGWYRLVLTMRYVCFST